MFAIIVAAVCGVLLSLISFCAGAWEGQRRERNMWLRWHRAALPPGVTRLDDYRRARARKGGAAR